MSTFKGIVSEFPGIRVDFFRQQAGFTPPLACFLSHIHSDHLAGLETFDGCFIYCSAATKELLLRLEKKSVRLNYARGILEDPRQQTYKHLEKKLKPLPLDTPISIELLPGYTIQVTLLDANHCVGAVMFLFEGGDKAVLYTGDIRCEPRLITAITQNPNMIEYSSGMEILDRIYLDTSVLDDYTLQPKAEGLQELLEKLRKYPADTIFHFQAWTYGYEEVWVALSKALNSKIHVDNYKMRVFESLVTKPKDNRWAIQTHLAKEAPALVGFTCGNSLHEGCLTRDENVRIHSCEKGMGCSVMDTKPIVWIRPIVTHLKDGRDVMEVGIGGGGEDLAQASVLTPEDILEILQLMSVNHRLPAELHASMDMLKKTLSSGRDISLLADLDGTAEDPVTQLVKSLLCKLEAIRNPTKERDETSVTQTLPNVIRFPYARHSSLPELREFTRVFKARDITPCTFDADLWLQKGWSIANLFGACCSGDTFEYDGILDRRAKELAVLQQDTERDDGSQQTSSSNLPALSPVGQHPVEDLHASNAATSISSLSTPNPVETRQEYGFASSDQVTDDLDSDYPDLQGDSQASTISDRAYATRRIAYDTAIANIDGSSWGTFGLISTTDNHTHPEEELGHHISAGEKTIPGSPDLSAL
ncbi:artemis protein [Xylaria bambusicola]|uniref:artemis protein n=1 Tax=Xylaria bambusicola TaxID=326684 RepID=UPI0020078188|nr:artemis protein [Xylaria bambusicola]KAI0505185.1 artemis protein [Xylaria bambusicola]